MLFTVLIAVVFAIMARNQDRSWLGWAILGGGLYFVARLITDIVILALFGQIILASETSAIALSLILGICVGTAVVFLGGSLMAIGRRTSESVHSILHGEGTTSHLTPGEETPGSSAGAQTRGGAFERS